MALWHNTQNNSVHDDMDGAAQFLPRWIENFPNWPNGAVQITQQEADILLAPTAEQLLAQKAAVLKNFISLRVTIINVLSSIAGKMERAGDTNSALACDVAATSFIGIESTPAFIAATDGLTAQAVILAAYQNIAATLSASSPSAAAEFIAMGLTYP